MQITPNVHMLTIPFSVPLPTGPITRTVNLFILLGEKITLIDTGIAGAEARIFDLIRSLGRSPDDISSILLTHSHPDHIGAAAAIRAATDCKVLVSAEERRWVEDTEHQERERPVPGFRNLVGGPVPVAGVLSEGDVLNSGGDNLTVEVLATPGHSAGSLSFHLRQHGLLFTGDAVPMPGDLPVYDNFRSALKSLQKIERVKEVRLLLEAWGEPLPPERRVPQAQTWLAQIDNAIRQTNPADDPMQRCSEIVCRLGLPAFAVNPLTARAFASHRNSGE